MNLNIDIKSDTLVDANLLLLLSDAKNHRESRTKADWRPCSIRCRLAFDSRIDLLSCRKTATSSKISTPPGADWRTRRRDSRIGCWVKSWGRFCQFFERKKKQIRWNSHSGRTVSQSYDSCFKAQLCPDTFFLSMKGNKISGWNDLSIWQRSSVASVLCTRNGQMGRRKRWWATTGRVADCTKSRHFESDMRPLRAIWVLIRTESNRSLPSPESSTTCGTQILDRWTLDAR